MFNPNFAGVIAIIGWVLTPLFVVYVTQVQAFQMTAIVLMFSFLIMFGYQLVFDRKKITSYWRQPLHIYLIGLLGFGIHNACFYSSIQFIPVYNAITVNYTWPLILVVMSFFVNKTRLSVYQLMGMIISCLGVAALFMDLFSAKMTAMTVLGYVFALGGALSWAIFSVLSRKVQWPTGAGAPFFLVSSMLMVLIHIGVDESTIKPNTLSWLMMFALGFTRISFSFWDYAIKKGNVLLLSSMAYFAPLGAMLVLVLTGYGPEGLAFGAASVLIATGAIVINGQGLIENLSKMIKPK